MNDLQSFVIGILIGGCLGYFAGWIKGLDNGERS